MAANGTDDNPQKEEWLALLNEMESIEPPSQKAATATPRPVAESEPAESGKDSPVQETPQVEPVAESENSPENEPADLGNIEGASRVPDEERTPEESERVKKALSRYDELRKKPSMQKMTMDDLRTWEELSEIMGAVNRAAMLIDHYRRDYIDKVPVDKFDQVEDNLKEVAAIMLREFHSLRHGKQAKQYDKRNVCTVCHAVYLVPLPDGVCDECRSRNATSRGEY